MNLEVIFIVFYWKGLFFSPGFPRVFSLLLRPINSRYNIKLHQWRGLLPSAATIHFYYETLLADNKIENLLDPELLTRREKSEEEKTLNRVNKWMRSFSDELAEKK